VKSEGEVRQKLKQVIFRLRKKHVEAVFRKAPETCRHNSTLEPMPREEIPGVQACFYTTDGVPRGVVCDVRFDNGARARSCSLWEPRGDKEQVKTEFHEVMESGNRGLIASKFPDVAALMWVLDGSLGDEPTEAEMESDPSTKGWDWGRWPWSKKR